MLTSLMLTHPANHDQVAASAQSPERDVRYVFTKCEDKGLTIYTISNENVRLMELLTLSLLELTR